MKRETRLVLRGTPEYPAMLGEIDGAPDGLYVVGRPLEPAPHVGVVGTRRASRYGLEAAAWIGRELATAGVVVVSGMAAGIDAAAHRGALMAGATVAVLGCGVDLCYPRANAGLYGDLAELGTLVSEYPPGIQPSPWRFPARNRIIAGMSLGVVIVEARRDGGAMITARLASEFGREVYALPGPVHAPGSEGPHGLVRDGARLVTCPQDILEDLGLGEAGRGAWAQSLFPARAASTRPGGAGPPGTGGSGAGAGGTGGSGAGAAVHAWGRLSPDEKAIIGVLVAEPTLLDRIAKLAGMPTSAAAAVLSRLELSGLVSRHPGGRFALPVDAARRPTPGRRRPVDSRPAQGGPIGS